MTQDNSIMSENDAGSGDLFNTAAGWVLFAAGLGLGLSILSGKYFHADNPERPETLGYVIEGVEEVGGGARDEALQLLHVQRAALLVWGWFSLREVLLVHGQDDGLDGVVDGGQQRGDGVAYLCSERMVHAHKVSIATFAVLYLFLHVKQGLRHDVRAF